jgi:hypothetical protein
MPSASTSKTCDQQPVRHQLTSSSNPGSTPARYMARARVVLALPVPAWLVEGGVAGMTGHPLAILEIVLREYLGSYRRDVADGRATISVESSDVSDRKHKRAVAG